MDTIKGPAKSQRQRVGGPLGVLLVIDTPSLLMRMADVARDIEGLRVVGTFSSAAQAVDWLVFDRAGWHLAFVDLGLGESGDELVQRLQSQPRPGVVVAVGDHLWREVREKCRAMGVHDLLEKGDVIAFRGYLESKVR
ncbi:response regulator [Ramlibacter sp. AN1133]|uniref:response regulator n=1 Tax=Ramlibacter sp. AN1133 TaxID=3133429 RepID=UPI0030C2997A